MSLTQKLDNHPESGYKVYIPNDCTSINGVRIRPNYRGYAVVPPLGVTLNNDIVKTIYADINGDNSTRVQGTLDGTNIKFVFSPNEWIPLHYSCVRDFKGNLIYNLQDYIKQLTPKFTGTITKTTSYVLNSYANGSVTQNFKDTTVGSTITYTITPNNGYIIDNVSLYRFNVSTLSTVDFSAATKIKDFGTNSNPSYTVVNDDIGKCLCLNATFKVKPVKPVEPAKPYTLADTGLKCNDENATLSVDTNTAILTATTGYKITSANIISKNPYDFNGNTEKTYDFTINNNGTTATITLVPTKDLNYSLKVTTEKVNKPTKSIFKGLYSLTQFQDRLKLSYDNNNTFIITTNDNKYTINSVVASFVAVGGFGTGTLTNGIISSDKHTYTLTLVPNDDWSPSDYQSIKFNVDVADTAPLNPTPENEHLTQRVYTVDENGLNDFVKQAVTMFKGDVTNYDYTSFVNQLYTLPFNLPATLSDPVSKVVTGLSYINTNAREFKDIYATVSCGTIKVAPENNNGFDKSIKSVTLYLPFVSALNLDIDDCYNKEIYIEYVTNLMTGITTINIYSDSKLLNTFNADIKNDLQLFNIYNNDNIGKLSSIIKNNLRTACIKVVYYEPVKDLVSYETLEHNKLTSYTNFVKTRNSSVSCGTQQEQKEIESLLDNGIIINNPTKN